MKHGHGVALSKCHTFIHPSLIHTTDVCLPEEEKTREVTMQHVAAFMVLVGQDGADIGVVVHMLQTLITPELFLTASATNRASKEPTKELDIQKTFRNEVSSIF